MLVVPFQNLALNKPRTLNPLLVFNTTPIVFTQNMGAIAELAYHGQIVCDPNTQDTQSNTNCKQLNAAPGYFSLLVRVDNIGTFLMQDTRNNAFTNREQKLTIISSSDTITAVASTAIGVVSLGILAAAGLGFVNFAKRHPDSKAAALYRMVATEEDTDNSELESRSAACARRLPILAPLIEWYCWVYIYII
jgi:hypothetical protein